MEDEKILSGYCRVMDCSRMVTVELSDDTIEDVDCCYGSCLYESTCPIAKAIRGLEKS